MPAAKPKAKAVGKQPSKDGLQEIIKKLYVSGPKSSGRIEICAKTANRSRLFCVALKTELFPQWKQFVDAIKHAAELGDFSKGKLLQMKEDLEKAS